MEAYLENGRLNSLSPEALQAAKEHPIPHWTARRSQVSLVVRNIFIDALALGAGAGLGLGAHHLYERYSGRVSTLHRRVWAYAGATIALSWTLFALQLRERMFKGYGFDWKQFELEAHSVSPRIAEELEDMFGRSNLVSLQSDYWRKEKGLDVDSSRGRVVQNKRNFVSKAFDVVKFKIMKSKRAELRLQLDGWWVKGNTSCRWVIKREGLQKVEGWAQTTVEDGKCNYYTYMHAVVLSERLHEIVNAHKLNRIIVPLMRLVPIRRLERSEEQKYVVIGQNISTLDPVKGLKKLRACSPDDQRELARQLCTLIRLSGLSDLHPENFKVTANGEIAVIDTKSFSRYLERPKTRTVYDNGRAESTRFDFGQPDFVERCALRGCKRFIDCGTSEAPELWLRDPTYKWPEIFRQEMQSEMSKINRRIGWRILEWAKILPVY